MISTRQTSMVTINGNASFTILCMGSPVIPEATNRFLSHRRRHKTNRQSHNHHRAKMNGVNPMGISAPLKMGASSTIAEIVSKIMPATISTSITINMIT